MVVYEEIVVPTIVEKTYAEQSILEDVIRYHQLRFHQFKVIDVFHSQTEGLVLIYALKRFPVVAQADAGEEGRVSFYSCLYSTAQNGGIQTMIQYIYI